MTALVATDRVTPWPDTSAVEGDVVWARPKSLWFITHLIFGAAGGVYWFSWSAVAIFFILMFLTICLGHSVGMHRLLIHRSFETPLWLEHLLVYLGALVGMAGPIGMFRIHEIRDWQQNQPDCHSFAKHDVGFWRDAFWQMHCEQILSHPPTLTIEDRVLNNQFYQWLERTWRLQQLPLAIALYLIGGWGFVFWGVSLRIVVSLTGHWCTVHFAHTHGERPFVLDGIAVDGRNLPALAVITFGESWHNNHHAFPCSARLGHHNGQIDPGWWVIRSLAAMGLAWAVNVPDLSAGRSEVLKAYAAKIPPIGPSPRCDRPGDVTTPPHHYIHPMNIRALLLAPIVALALTLPAQAEKIGLKTLSQYLNALSSAETDFTQVNADGTISTGKLYIKRPGRVRFEYAAPDNSLVLASAGNVAIFDSKSNQPPEQYPLTRTPLNLILAETVDLGRASMVVGHTADGTSTHVKAQDPQHPEYGTIELVFTADPVTLRQWIITDDAGSETTVILGELKGGGKYPTSLFSIEAENSRRGG